MASSSVARADGNVEDRPRLSFSVGVGGGAQSAGGDGWGGPAVELGLDWRLAKGVASSVDFDVALQRLYSGGGADSAPDRDGTLARAALGIRRPIVTHRFDWSATGQLWFAAQAAMARYAVDEGTASRRELVLGFGGSLLGFPRRGEGKQKFPAFQMSLRVVVADAMDLPGPIARCAKDCGGGATGDPADGVELGFYWTFGFAWGM